MLESDHLASPHLAEVLGDSVFVRKDRGSLKWGIPLPIKSNDPFLSIRNQMASAEDLECKTLVPRHRLPPIEGKERT